MPAASAVSFTGELDVSCPRPRGRSGCVTTLSTRKSGCAIMCRSDGTANAGVPQNTRRSATSVLPLAGFFQFFDFPLDHVALQHAQVIQEENSIQMIDLMAERACQQPLAPHLEFFSRRVLRPNRYVLRPLDVAAKPRHRKAAFLLALRSFRMNDLGVRA